MICNTYKLFFSSLADQTRLEIIHLLRKGPKNVTQICNELKFEQSRVSHNLRKLREFGFVTSKVAGKTRVYSIDKKVIVPILRLIDKHVNIYYKHYCKCKKKTKRNNLE